MINEFLKSAQEKLNEVTQKGSADGERALGDAANNGENKVAEAIADIKEGFLKMWDGLKDDEKVSALRTWIDGNKNCCTEANEATKPGAILSPEQIAVHSA